MISIQPRHKGYWALINGIKGFLDSMDRRTYTYINFPYRKSDKRDSVFFIKTLQKRLAESHCIEQSDRLPDTVQLKNAILKYQKQKGLTADGLIGPVLIRTLNTSDDERFKRIAITLDRYKQMPLKMPEKYIWVNLPGFYLRVIDADTLVLESKVICGKPETRTPLLNSEISDMITYPTWTVPTSIIAKSYLPKLKNNPNYLSRIGLKLVNGKGEDVDPAAVNWSKYSRGIPFKVMQNSGDNNALGVMKFNFSNPFAVYLHDTNQRYLFKRAARALSHGCVRVQEWEKLAFYIARNDSASRTVRDSMRYNTDSIRSWIAQKSRHRIEVRKKLPLFIRYFTCEGKEGKIVFYDDIYGEDKVLRDKFFATK
ncbi:MAG: L,D-transpeptidase family protein [Chitinophagaceae bacterium]|nr:L,D-transpeptidase family protein [Chitinophagaceae bacterium]